MGEPPEHLPGLYVQGRGELRRGRGEHTGQLRDLVMISQRAAEADDRAVPGHWEGDRADRSLRLLA
ncbi:MAG TPA: hypothetical protein VI751_04025 [Actinomycetota bacterium]